MNQLLGGPVTDRALLEVRNSAAAATNTGNYLRRLCTSFIRAVITQLGAIFNSPYAPGTLPVLAYVFVLFSHILSGRGTVSRLTKAIISPLRTIRLAVLRAAILVVSWCYKEGDPVQLTMAKTASTKGQPRENRTPGPGVARSSRPSAARSSVDDLFSVVSGQLPKRPSASSITPSPLSSACPTPTPGMQSQQSDRQSLLSGSNHCGSEGLGSQRTSTAGLSLGISPAEYSLSSIYFQADQPVTADRNSPLRSQSRTSDAGTNRRTEIENSFSNPSNGPRRAAETYPSISTTTTSSSRISFAPTCREKIPAPPPQSRARQQKALHSISPTTTPPVPRTLGRFCHRGGSSPLQTVLPNYRDRQSPSIASRATPTNTATPVAIRTPSMGGSPSFSSVATQPAGMRRVTSVGTMSPSVASPLSALYAPSPTMGNSTTTPGPAKLVIFDFDKTITTEHLDECIRPDQITKEFVGTKAADPEFFRDFCEKCILGGHTLRVASMRESTFALNMAPGTADPQDYDVEEEGGAFVIKTFLDAILPEDRGYLLFPEHYTCVNVRNGGKNTHIRRLIQRTDEHGEGLYSPDQVILIDDNESNVAAAEQAGYAAFCCGETGFTGSWFRTQYALHHLLSIFPESAPTPSLEPKRPSTSNNTSGGAVPAAIHSKGASLPNNDANLAVVESPVVPAGTQSLQQPTPMTETEPTLCAAPEVFKPTSTPPTAFGGLPIAATRTLNRSLGHTYPVAPTATVRPLDSAAPAVQRRFASVTAVQGFSTPPPQLQTQQSTKEPPPRPGKASPHPTAPPPLSRSLGMRGSMEDLLMFVPPGSSAPTPTTADPSTSAARASSSIEHDTSRSNEVFGLELTRGHGVDADVWKTTDAPPLSASGKSKKRRKRRTSSNPPGANDYSDTQQEIQ